MLKTETPKSKAERHKILIALVVLFLVSFACRSPTPPTTEPAMDVIQVIAWTQTAAVQSIPPTNTLPPTPTKTRVPTETAEPTATSVPEQPITLTGTGDTVVDFDKWNGPALMRVTHNGSRNFMLRTYPADSNDYYDLLINTVGSYQGVLPLDFRDGEHTSRLVINADGPWEMHIDPLDTIKFLTVPGTYQSVGDDVVGLDGRAPDLLKIDASFASGNFIVEATTGVRELLVNEIAPYTGTVVLSNDTTTLIVTASGPWNIGVTAR